MLNSDLPIKTADEDVLNRMSFSKNLAKVMLEYSTPEAFAIGLYGKWGSGKTSVINMILEQIDVLTKNDVEKTIILRFNPWLCSDPRQLISQFFKQLSTAIKIKQPRISRVCSFMDDYADAFELTSAIPVAGSILATIAKILGKKVKSYKESKNSDLQDIKNTILSTLLTEKVKIIVTIDDVDRLSNNEIVSVFQLVKSLADFPYTIYLLAFDHEVVVRALSEVQKGNGAEYLEKVIQVPFELPTPNANDIYQVFFNKLNTIISDIPNEKWDKDAWSEIFHNGIKYYIRSIRDIIRFSNVLALKYALLKDETDVIDLISLTCIQVFELNVYKNLPFYKDQLCGTISQYPSSNQREEDKIQETYNFIVSEVPERNKETIKYILKMLFPKLNSLPNQWSGSSKYYDRKKSLVGGNISNPNCFDRYFALNLEHEAIPTSTINYLLFESTESELMDGIKQINSKQKIIRFLDHVQACFETNIEKRELSKRARLVFMCLVRSWEYLDDNDQAFLSTPFKWRLLFCSDSLLELINQQERYTIVEFLFKDIQVSLSTILILLHNFELQHNRFTDKDKNNEKQILALAEVCKLEELFLNRTMDELATGVLLNHSDALNIIWLFEQIAPSLWQDKNLNIITDDLSLAKLIRSAVSHGKGASTTVFPIWSVSKESIGKYINIEEAYKRMLSYSMTKEFRDLVHDMQEDIAAFLIEMELTEREKDPFNSIVSSNIEQKLKEIYSSCLIPIIT